LLPVARATARRTVNVVALLLCDWIAVLQNTVDSTM
jgi:hypothetical protein